MHNSHHFGGMIVPVPSSKVNAKSSQWRMLKVMKKQRQGSSKKVERLWLALWLYLGIAPWNACRHTVNRISTFVSLLEEWSLSVGCSIASAKARAPTGASPVWFGWKGMGDPLPIESQAASPRFSPRGRGEELGLHNSGWGFLVLIDDDHVTGIAG